MSPGLLAPIPLDSASSSPWHFFGYFLDHRAEVVTRRIRGERVDYLICDEAQFYSVLQAEQLARVVDELAVDVYAFGIMADFRTRR